METTKEMLEARVRETPLLDRLKGCRQRIGKMCSEGRPPRMCIPVQHDDDDFFISTTLADAQATVEALQRERDQWREAFERSCADAAHLKAALDAERAIVARLEEEYAEKCVAKDNYITTLIEAKNKVSSKLTQLQALVRALPNLEHFDVGVDDHGGEIRLPDGYILFTATSRNRTYALEKLLKYRASLDATTPAATIGEQCSYCQKPLTTNHSFSYGFPGVPRVYKCDRTECIKPKGGDGE